MKPYIIPILIFSLILQESFFSFPFVFVILTAVAIKEKRTWIFSLAFFSGLILDSLYFKTIGTTSIFFLLFVFALFTYERKFETNSAFFIFASSFLGAMVLFLILGDNFILFKSLITAVLTMAVLKTW